MLIEMTPAQAFNEGNGRGQVVDPEVQVNAGLADLLLGDGLDVDHGATGDRGSELEPSLKWLDASRQA
jgi:hypothetical protein